MNYIARLKKENELLQAGLENILQYLCSEKFDVDISVNKKDIIMRIMEIRNDLFRMEDEK